MTQSISTWISVANPFNLSNTDFTIEAFIIILNDSMDANIVQFSSGMSMNITMDRLEFNLNQNYIVSSISTISTNVWHHVAVVYNSINQYINVYIDGQSVGQLGYLLGTNSENENITMIIGYGFQGFIDQLSISLEAKTDDQILWDATVGGYYPFDGDNNGWLLDYGPNCVNATSAGTQSVSGQVRDALSFVTSGAYYQVTGFTALNIAYHAFTVALWVQPGNQSGIFLTIANSISCLLVLGIRNNDNSIVAYLPNSTNTSIGVNIIGSSMTNNQWVNIAFTWSNQNQAQLYQQTALQGRNTNAIKLNNGYGDPMTITLGMYRGQADCTSGNGLDTMKQFSGSLDEFYIFSRELQQNEIEQLSLTTNS